MQESIQVQKGVMSMLLQLSTLNADFKTGILNTKATAKSGVSPSTMENKKTALSPFQIG